MSARSKAIALLLKCSREVWCDFQLAMENSDRADQLWEAWKRVRRAINYLEAAA